jgi:hypothetical protein
MFCLQLHCNTLSYDREPGQGSMHPPRIRENRERCRVPIAKPSSRPKFQTAFPREARAESRAGKPRTTTTPVASQGCGVQSWTLASALSIAAGQLYGVGNVISLMTVTTTCSGRRTSGGHIVIDHANDKTRPGIGDIPQRDSGLPHHVADCRRIEIADFTEN